MNSNPWGNYPDPGQMDYTPTWWDRSNAWQQENIIDPVNEKVGSWLSKILSPVAQGAAAIDRWTTPNTLEALAQKKKFQQSTTPYENPEGVGENLYNAALTAFNFLGGTPPATGMIRWGAGKEYPNAMLHRAIGNPKELGWWNRIFQRAESTQKPTSVVTPSVLQTFQSEPYGLLFNVNEPNQIKHAGYGDLSSAMTKSSPWLDRINKEQRDISAAIRKLSMSGKADSPEVASLQEAMRSMPWDEAFASASETWKPTRRKVIQQEQTLQDLLGKQLAEAKTMKSEPLEFIWDEPGATAKELWHSEIIPEIDRSMLAGVRLPLKTNGVLTSGIGEQLYSALKQFAEQQNVPIYRWPAVQTIDQEIKGLSGDPFRGKWGWKPGTREYKTSSQLPEIFGIRELP